MMETEATTRFGCWFVKLYFMCFLHNLGLFVHSVVLFILTRGPVSFGCWVRFVFLAHIRPCDDDTH